MNKRNLSKLLVLSCRKYKTQCNLLVTYEISKTQRFNSKLKQRQLLSYLWFHKTDVKVNE